MPGVSNLAILLFSIWSFYFRHSLRYKPYSKKKLVNIWSCSPSCKAALFGGIYISSSDPKIIGIQHVKTDLKKTALFSLSTSNWGELLSIITESAGHCFFKKKVNLKQLCLVNIMITNGFIKLKPIKVLKYPLIK